VSLKKSLTIPNVKNILFIFETVFKLKRRKVLRLRAVEFYHALNWVIYQTKIIQDRERKNLTSRPDPKLKAAGLADLDKFAELNTLISIAEKFGTTPQKVDGWRYDLVFAIQYHNKTTADINKQYLINQQRK
jgi:hypothetical protein